MKRVDATAQRFLLLTPQGRDGHIAQSLLHEAGFGSTILETLPTLVDEIRRGAAGAIVAEEALLAENIAGLIELLTEQPEWSDFPFMLLSSHGGGQERIQAARRWAETLGNVTVIERPFHPTTLVAAVRSAARSRHRQYEARARTDALHESEQRLRMALVAARLGGWTLDVADRTLSTSPACRAHFGRGEHDNFGHADLLASVHADEGERLERALARAIATGDDCTLEFRNVWPDGTVHWVDLRAHAVIGADNKVTTLVGVSADISARKSAEIEREHLLLDLAQERSALADLNATLEARVAERTEELMREVAARERAQDQLRQAQKMESIGQLTGGIAHDFNNLLMAVMAALNLLRKRIPETPQTKTLMDGALQAAERGASLTQRLLAFARRQDLQTSVVSLHDLVHGMCDLIDRSLGPRFQLSIEASPSMSGAEVDANQLELAILNLVINARDAMPDGGPITIRVGHERATGVPGLADGRYCAVKVKDAGTGMDEETLAKAVEPFFSTKAVGKGTGLGLSMVHGLAVQLGGGLKLESSPGKGTTATIYLPCSDLQPGTSVEAEEVEATAGRQCRVLLVDDDPLVAALTRSMLEELGHSVVEVHSGDEALSALRGDRSFHLLMSDYLMPGMTGMELIAEAHTLRPDMAVLLATGFADMPDGKEVDVPRISKPYGLDELRQAIEALAMAEPPSARRVMLP